MAFHKCDNAMPFERTCRSALISRALHVIGLPILSFLEVFSGFPVVPPFRVKLFA